MNLVNSVTLIGNLGADPKVKEFGDGGMVANFSVATKEYFKEKDEFKTRTYWHNVVAWGKEAKKVQEKCTKGTEVVLSGKLTNRSYEDAKGVKHWIYEVVVNEIICRPKVA